MRCAPPCAHTAERSSSSTTVIGKLLACRYRSQFGFPYGWSGDIGSINRDFPMPFVKKDFKTL